MKKLFVFTLAFLMMVSSFLIVTAKEETETNPLSAAIKEICADPWEIESLSFSINPGHIKDNPYWKNYSYFTRDKESLLDAAQLLSKLEVSESGKTVTVDDACSAFLWITMKDGSMFELSYHDMNVLFYNGREYHGSIYDFADALYEIRMNEEPNSIVMPIAEENCYTVDLGEFDVNKITFTERYDDGTKKVMTFEDTDNINELIGVIRRYMSLTYDGVTSEMPDDVTTLEIEVDDWYGGTKMLYIAPGKIDGTNVTNGRVWYEDKEYSLDTILFDGFVGTFSEIAATENKVYESDNEATSGTNTEDTTITPDFPTEDVYTIRYIDCTYEDGILKEHTIYDIEGVSVCAKIMEQLEGMTFKHFDGDVANSGNINYTEIVLTDWKGYNRELVFRYGKLCVLEEYFDYDAGELSDFKKFMDDFENKTVVDPNADDMVGTALSDDIAALLSDSSDIQSFTFTAEKLGGVTRSKADAPYDFSYMTSDPAYINEAVKLLAKCEFSKQPKIHEEVGYTEVTVTFWTANGKFELQAYANGKVAYNGTYYGYLSQLCEDVYKLRSREAGKGIIMKSGTSEYFELDLFAKDVVKLTYKGVGSEAVTIDDAEKIEKIGAYVRNYIWLTNAQKASVADVESSVLTIEYADGTSGKVFFTNFADGKVLVQDGATVRNYFMDDYEFDSFEQFFEFYEMADSIKISDWAKPELEKAVLYGFGGIGDFSDDYSKNLTRLEVCDILVYPVNDIIGIHVMNMEPPYIDVYSQSVLDLTSVGAVEGKDVITVDGAVWKRIFAPDDLVTREELAKIACGIYRGGDYSTFSGYKADYELSDVTNTSFNDDEEISDWAKPYVEMARELGIFKGDDKGNFNPKGNCTKEEVIAVGVRLYEMMLENVK